MGVDASSFGGEAERTGNNLANATSFTCEISSIGERQPIF